jgi:3-hydroxybutyryl-CoA dehydrogenase
MVRGDDAVLASNTSSLSIARLAAATTRPERVIGLHFFNPVPVMPLVEVVNLPSTAPAVPPWVEAFLTGHLGKTVVRSGDEPGFVVNALLLPYLLSAVRLVESGRADAEDVDTGMVLGCGHPMGPLRLADLVGLDTLAAMACRLHADTDDPALRPPPLLLGMVERGLLGRKSGRGFYEYP